MPDIVDPATRSRIMARIRGKDTKPEMIVRQGLHARGFRYRLHDRRLPGSPDLVFRRWNAVILVHGCFWHGHDCHLFKWPASRAEFWRRKITGNRERDAGNLASLRDLGWRTLVIRECALKGRHRRPVDTLLDQAAFWLASTDRYLELQGPGEGLEQRGEPA